MQKIEIATFIRWYNSMGAKHKNADISCYEFLFLLLSFNQSDHINALYRHKNIKTWPRLNKNRFLEKINFKVVNKWFNSGQNSQNI